MPTLSVSQAAYIAGILDGEGSLSINRRAKRGNSGFDHCPDVRIEMSSRKVIDFLASTGFGSTCSRPPRTHKPMHLWWLRRPEIAELLEQVVPYMIEKKTQAELLIRLSRMREQNTDRRPVADEERRQREEIYDSVKKLNRKAGSKVSSAKTFPSRPVTT